MASSILFNRTFVDNLAPLPKIIKPIFLVGCSKSGTTMLGMILQLHPDVGPKTIKIPSNPNVSQLMASLTDPSIFSTIAPAMEEKKVWDEFFPINGVQLRTGKELKILKNTLNKRDTRRLKRLLTKNFYEKRLFSKAPFNTFRIHMLREMFPDAKILAIHRNGLDVIASWGDEVNRWKNMGGYEKCIPVFAKKWNEAIEHIEKYKRDVEVFTLRYEDLVSDTRAVLNNIFEYCELDFYEQAFGTITLGNRLGGWEKRIPGEYHHMALALTLENRKKLGYC